MAQVRTYVKGDWKTVCDVCGREYLASQLQKRWDNLMVCMNDWEPRQPQDFVRGTADIQAPPWTKPEQSDVFLDDVTIDTEYDIALDIQSDSDPDGILIYA